MAVRAGLACRFQRQPRGTGPDSRLGPTAGERQHLVLRAGVSGHLDGRGHHLLAERVGAAKQSGRDVVEADRRGLDGVPAGVPRRLR